MEVVMIVLWFFCLFNNDLRNPTLPSKFKFQNGLFTFLLFFMHGSGFQWFIWIARHPNEIGLKLGFDPNTIPMSIIVILTLLSALLDCLAVIYAYGLTKLNNKARIKILYIIPLIAIPSIHSFIVGAMENESVITKNEILLYTSLGFGTLGALYFWMYYFYNSKKNILNFLDAQQQKVRE